MPEFSPTTNYQDIQDLKKRVDGLERIVEALKADLTDPNEGEAALVIPPAPRTLRELGITSETADREPED